MFRKSAISSFVLIDSNKTNLSISAYIVRIENGRKKKNNCHNCISGRNSKGGQFPRIQTYTLPTLESFNAIFLMNTLKNVKPKRVWNGVLYILFHAQFTASMKRSYSSISAWFSIRRIPNTKLRFSVPRINVRLSRTPIEFYVLKTLNQSRLYTANSFGCVENSI